MKAKKKAGASTKKPVVASAPKQSELLVTLDRVIAFLDHATVALNNHSSTVKGLVDALARTPVAPSRSEERRVAVQTATPKIEYSNQRMIDDEAPVEHTASYNIVMKKLPVLVDHEAIDLLVGQIKGSVRLTKEEKVELLEACAARKSLVPF